MHNGPFDVSWQQFAATGPTAFLPLFDNKAVLIWYHHADKISQLKQLEMAQLKQEIQSAFPDDLADFNINAVASFPIQRLHATKYYDGIVMLIGDAAHCINPLAGQGVNLGFKDLNILLKLIEQKGEPRNYRQRQSLFRNYENKRRYDNLLMMSAMDGFYATFSNDIAPIKLIRNFGLGIAAQLTPLKRQVLKYAVGLT